MIPIAYAPIYKHPLPENHRFPMEKYELIPQQLVYEGSFCWAHFFNPEPMDESVIERIHDEAYIAKLQTGEVSRKEARRIGFPYSRQLLERELCITYGTIQGALKAFETGISFNIAGGTHHANAYRGEGFCIYNDIAVAAQYLLDQSLCRQILVVDLDVHQGNGTAEIFANEERVFTFSMHGAKNFPLHKAESDLDIPLPNGTQNHTYLNLLNHHLPKLINQVKPDFIFYQSGVDLLESDKLGKLGISREGSKKRDELVLKLAHHYNIPVNVVMGGGYSSELRAIIEAHCNTYRLAKTIFEDPSM